ncbi:gene enhancer ISL-1-like isoform X1 [Octopus vulgaris]|uniref:Insulin gene enhancer protein ISL-1 n=1 Tax=Octopus vulgaris TaxID=6645 RepID=A0AA36BHW7_OCTVU|nr:gene enhancer ISL-1-like isoform X1 [Octopus vulgaris]
MTETQAKRRCLRMEILAEKRRVSMCVGCGSQIHDQYILRVAPDLEWHAACLKCADCEQYLDETCTCFVRDGKTYCKRDYVRLFGTKCAKCGLGFSRNDFVMRAKSKIYHIDCFRCVACSRQLIPGDEFALREDGLFCKSDHDVVERASSVNQNGNSGGVTDANGNTTTSNNNLHSNGSSNSSGEGRMGQGLQMAGRAEQMSSNRTGGMRPHVHKTEQKTTRVRTVLNEKQLHTLRTCYNANPRPDALMKEQLVEMTGLSPRVIRVWFQNKRCKDKKKNLLMKQMQQQQEKNGNRLQGPLQGVPMVASSPVRHESPMQANPVEVQSYQPAWKALTEFTLQNDLDHPPFQQLLSSSYDSVESEHLSQQGESMIPSYLGTPLSIDDLSRHPSSMSSDFGGSPSELSSPISQ